MDSLDFSIYHRPLGFLSADTSKVEKKVSKYLCLRSSHTVHLVYMGGCKPFDYPGVVCLRPLHGRLKVPDTCNISSVSKYPEWLDHFSVPGTVLKTILGYWHECLLFPSTFADGPDHSRFGRMLWRRGESKEERVRILRFHRSPPSRSFFTLFVVGMCGVGGGVCVRCKDPRHCLFHPFLRIETNCYK